MVTTSDQWGLRWSEEEGTTRTQSRRVATVTGGSKWGRIDWRAVVVNTAISVSKTRSQGYDKRDCIISASPSLQGTRCTCPPLSEETKPRTGGSDVGRVFNKETKKRSENPKWMVDLWHV